MAENANVFGSAITGNASVQGEDYEYDVGSISQHYQDELAALTHQQELKEEYDRVNSPLGERNMAILSTLISSREVVNNIRNDYIDNKIREAGTMANAGVNYDEKTGQWLTTSGDPANFTFKTNVSDSTFWEKGAEKLLGWHQGIVQLTDGKYVPEAAPDTPTAKPTVTNSQKDEIVSALGVNEELGDLPSDNAWQSVQSDELADEPSIDAFGNPESVEKPKPEKFSTIMASVEKSNLKKEEENKEDGMKNLSESYASTLGDIHRGYKTPKITLGPLQPVGPQVKDGDWHSPTFEEGKKLLKLGEEIV